MFFYWANTNQVSRITTDSTPLKFVCTRNLTSVDSLTFSRPIRNAVSYIRFLGAVSKISRICKIVGVFVHCLFPSPSPPSFRLRVSFRAAVTFTLRTTKKKKKKKKKIYIYIYIYIYIHSKNRQLRSLPATILTKLQRKTKQIDKNMMRDLHDVKTFHIFRQVNGIRRKETILLFFVRKLRIF